MGLSFCQNGFHNVGPGVLADNFAARQHPKFSLKKTCFCQLLPLQASFLR
jgi:hypothetical protein